MDALDCGVGALPRLGDRLSHTRDVQHAAAGRDQPARLLAGDAGTEHRDPVDAFCLLETLDHLLDRGVVIAGEATISIGDVDLLYLGLNIVLANVDALTKRRR